MTIRVPNEYNACEAYKGFVIILHQGLYRGLGHDRNTGWGTSRAAIRRLIDGYER